MDVVNVDIYRMAEKAQSLLPIWLRALPLTMTARTHQTLTPLSRNLTVWAASTREMYQLTKLTAHEVKDKMTKALFQRTLSVTVNRLCRAGLPADVNPLIGMVLMSLQFEWGCLWRSVCCCLTLNLFICGTLIAATTARGSWRFYFKASVEQGLLIAITCSWHCSLFLQMVTAILCQLKPSVPESPCRLNRVTLATAHRAIFLGFCKI